MTQEGDNERRKCFEPKGKESSTALECVLKITASQEHKKSLWGREFRGDRNTHLSIVCDYESVGEGWELGRQAGSCEVLLMSIFFIFRAVRSHL